MRRIHPILISAATAALAVSMLGVPVAAAPVGQGRIVIVNGVPGQKVDFCLNGKEVKSAVRYGRKYVKLLKNGRYVLKVFAKSPRTCRGTKLSQKTLIIAGEDLTIVATRKKPSKLLVFKLPYNAPSPSALAGWAVRHAADFGKVDLDWVLGATSQPGHAYRKGQSRTAAGTIQNFDLRVTVTKPGKTAIVTGPKTQHILSSHYYEWILLGTTKKNAKLIKFGLPIDA